MKKDFVTEINHLLSLSSFCLFRVDSPILDSPTRTFPLLSCSFTNKKSTTLRHIDLHYHLTQYKYTGCQNHSSWANFTGYHTHLLFKMELYLKHLNGPLWTKKRQSVGEICCLVFVVVVVFGFYLLYQSNLSFGSFLMKVHILYSTMNHYSFKISPDIIQNISFPRAGMLTLSCIYLSCNSV